MSNNPEAAPRRSLLTSLTSWLDAGAGLSNFDKTKVDQVDWLRVIPFIGMHVACLAIFTVGVSTTAAVVAGFMYVIRMFAITGFYHRYFSHRVVQDLARRPVRVRVCWAPPPCSAARSGGLRTTAITTPFSDQPSRTVHSPVQRGFLWSHMGWFLSRRHFATRPVPRTRPAALPGAALLDRFDILVPVALAVGVVRARRGAGALCTRPGHQSLADAGVGLLRLHRGHVSRHLHDQLAVPSLRRAPVRHQRRQPQQPAGWRC